MTNNFLLPLGEEAEPESPLSRKPGQEAGVRARSGFDYTPSRAGFTNFISSQLA